MPEGDIPFTVGPMKPNIGGVLDIPVTPRKLPGSEKVSLSDPLVSQFNEFVEGSTASVQKQLGCADCEAAKRGFGRKLELALGWGSETGVHMFTVCQVLQEINYRKAYEPSTVEGLAVPCESNQATIVFKASQAKK